MPIKKLLLMSCLLVFAFVNCSFSITPERGQFSINGYIRLSPESEHREQTPIRLLTVKLYPPKESGKPVLITYPDNTNTFRFSNLPADSYLLELYLGDQLQYQRLLTLESHILLAIPLGNFKLVDKVTVEERKSQSLTASDFNGAVTISAGDIDKSLLPNRGPLSLTILGDTKRVFRLTPPKLVVNFKYKGQTYILTGAVRRTHSDSKEFIDCEIYRKEGY